MSVRLKRDSMNSSFANYRHVNANKSPARQSSDRLEPIRIVIRRPETRLSPNDELECRQIYEKLQRLQPNGVCVNLDTLRRALYPPMSFTTTTSDEILKFKSYRQRYTKIIEIFIYFPFLSVDEMPRIRLHDVPKVTRVNKLEPINLDRITNQVKKHAAINYSYYTRTK